MKSYTNFIVNWHLYGLFNSKILYKDVMPYFKTESPEMIQQGLEMAQESESRREDEVKYGSSLSYWRL